MTVHAGEGVGSRLYCEALHAYEGGKEDISFGKGAVIEVLSLRVEAGDDWALGRLPDGSEGIFPKNYVQIRDGV
jgi:hypothetical protein